MSAADPTSDRETRRLAALGRYGLLDTPPEETFDRITRLAADRLRAPFALVSLVDRDRIWVKSRIGLELEQLRRVPKRRRSPLLPDDVLWVCDAAREACFQSLEGFDAAAMIRFYAAAPLVTYDGFTLGTLCVMDREPRPEDEALKRELGRLARALMKEIETRRLLRRLEGPERGGLQVAGEDPRRGGSADPLTGLGQRRELLDRLAAEIERARRSAGAGAALLVLDLDRFQAINGALGYASGDRVLIECARRLGGAAASGDLVARLGGDEMAILVTGLGRVEEARRRAREVLRRLRWPMRLGKRRLSVTASLGVAWIDEHYKSADEVLRDAEIAMSRAKSQGRARYEVFDASQHRVRIEQLEIETDLPGALERRELRLHYQPIVELATGRLRGFEALARWQHPRRGLLRPGDFLAAAAVAGLMPDLCRFTLEAACRQLASWHRRFPRGRHWTMSVNLDCQHLRESAFGDLVDRVLRRSGLAPGALVLEVTETAMMSRSARSNAVLHELETRGIALHIDDFGTGYATLSYLHRLPSRAVKIDASFVTGMTEDARHRQIVAGIVDLAHNLGLEVIAEGIETPLQLRDLLRMGCDHGQGFYISRPLDAESLTALLADDVAWIGDPEVRS